MVRHDNRNIEVVLAPMVMKTALQYDSRAQSGKVLRLFVQNVTK
jgi:hypothetical protein